MSGPPILPMFASRRKEARVPIGGKGEGVRFDRAGGMRREKKRGSGKADRGCGLLVSRGFSLGLTDIPFTVESLTRGFRGPRSSRARAFCKSSSFTALLHSCPLSTCLC